MIPSSFEACCHILVMSWRSSCSLPSRWMDFFPFFFFFFQRVLLCEAHNITFHYLFCHKLSLVKVYSQLVQKVDGHQRVQSKTYNSNALK